MATNTKSETPAEVTPDEVFAILGNETRLQILQTLRKADELLTFSELFARVEYDDYSNFDYHLRKLEGQFARKTDDGYDLTGTSRRIMAAVLSGTVAEEPVIEPIRIDEQCPYCGAAIEVGFQREHVEMYCSECPGVMHEAGPKGRYFSKTRFLCHFALPPAGIQDRTPEEVLAAAWTWGRLNVLADSAGLCSRCSAPIDYSVIVCEEHDATEGYCEQCGRRYAVRFRFRCQNCHYVIHGLAIERLLASTEVLAFLTTHGINPLAPQALGRAFATIADYEEEVLSTDPFKARFTITADGDALTLSVDEDLSVADVTRREVSEIDC